MTAYILEHDSGNGDMAEHDHDPDADDAISDYEPEELAIPILPTPLREDFMDTKNRLQQFVTEKVIGQGGLATRYRYSPLKDNEIRLVEIEPGEDKAEIKCKMLYGTLNNDKIFRKYHALSYHWGTDVPTNRITIRDHRAPPKPNSAILLSKHNKLASLVSQVAVPERKSSNESWFPVRDNLISALRALRQRRKPIRVWVDAISINQDPKDDKARAEKQQQIKNMAHIYNSAFGVSIWLGDGNSRTDKGMTFVKKIVKELPDLESHLANKDFEEDWMAFRDLMTFKWFSRRWVVQEVALARRATVHCGRERIDWNDFADGVALFVDNRDRMVSHTRDPSRLEGVAALGANVLVTAVSNLSRKSDDGDIHGNLVGLEALVSTLLFFEASNPHDYIFSLLALARDNPQQYCLPPEQPLPFSEPHFQIKVDYEIDAIDLFKQFTHQCIHISESLDIVCRHWAPDVEGKDEDGSAKELSFPSWILKLSKSSYGTAKDTLQGRRGADSLVGCPYRDGRKTYNAANGSKPIYNFEEPIGETGLPRVSTDRSASTNDSFSTQDISSSVVASAALSRRTTHNDTTVDTSTDAIQEHDFADLTERLRERPSRHRGERKDSATFVPRASTRSSSVNSISIDRTFQGMLHVMGTELGKIKKRSSRIMEAIVPAQWLEACGWDHKQPGRVPDILWRTLVADRGPDGHFPPRWYHRACIHCLSDSSLMTNNHDLDARRTPKSDIMAQFLNRVRCVVYNRQFFVGGKNKDMIFGLAPEDAAQGDYVCVLAGCTVPVVLRKHKDKPDHFQFIGEAYVHGKMDGEALAAFSVSQPAHLAKELRWFTLV